MRLWPHWEQHLAIVAVGLTLGFLIAVQVQTLRSQQMTASTMRAPMLIERLVSSQEQIQQLRAEVDKLREQLREYEGAMAEGRTATEEMAAELNRLRVLAGLTRVRGSGIVVWLKDADKPPPAPNPEVGMELGIVHDTDLLLLVNELRAAGAEAIAINDQRVVTTTAIRCIGPLITVNGVRISPPYEVAAIGDPDKLGKALTMPDGIVDNLRRLGIPVKITPHSDLIVPSLSVTPKLEFTRPAEQ